MCVHGLRHVAHLMLFFQAHSQGAESEVEQLELEPAPLWEMGIAGYRLTRHDTWPALHCLISVLSTFSLPFSIRLTWFHLLCWIFLKIEIFVTEYLFSEVLYSAGHMLLIPIPLFSEIFLAKWAFYSQPVLTDFDSHQSFVYLVLLCFNSDTSLRSAEYTGWLASMHYYFSSL